MSTVEDLELIDWENSVKLADNDTDLAKDILVLTARSLPTDKLEIAAAFEKEDEREMRRLLHKLEGGISYTKLPRLAMITDELHEVIKSESGEEIVTLHQTLQQTISDTIQAIHLQIKN